MITTRPDRAALTDDEFARFRDLVRREIGLVIGEGRRRDVERVVGKTLAEAELPSVDELYAHLTEGAGRTRLETFVGDLTIGETHFFRNRPQFEALERHILPGLIERRKETRRLRIWSAACSTGEEPYSLAILIKRLIPDLEEWNVTILATDINKRAIEEAQRGIYSPWSFRDVPKGIESRYFSADNGEREISPEVKSLVTFGYLNLVEDAYPSLPTNTTAMDLILCRNVLMYFDDATARKVAERLRQSLSDEGWLLVAPVEFSHSVFRHFKARSFPGTVAYQKSADVEPIEHRHPGAPQIPDLHEAGAHPEPAAAGTDSIAEPPPPELLADELEAVEQQAMANPEDARAAYDAAKLLAGQLDLESAERWIETAIQRAPLFAPAYYLKGLILLEAGRPDDALAALRRCVFSDPAFTLGHFVLGGLFARLGQTTRALKALDNAFELLDGLDSDAPVPEGDGLTAGRLGELVDVQKELVSSMGSG